MPYLGGFNITKIEWAGRNAVAVTIEHSYAADVRFQLYANKQLIGVTHSQEETRILGAVPAGVSAAPLGVLVVEPENAQVDYSGHLDLRPYNEYRVSWTAPVDPPADLHHFDIVAGLYAGEVVNLDNVIARVPYNAGMLSFSYLLPTFPSRGDWQVAVIPRDDAWPDGNAGDSIDVEIPTIIYPIDFELLSDSPVANRFTAAVEDGVLSIELTEGTVPSYP